VDKLREAVRAAFAAMERALSDLENPQEGADVLVLQGKFDEACEAHTAACKRLERSEALAEARAALPVEVTEPGTEPGSDGHTPEPARATRVEWDSRTQHVGGEPSVYQAGGPHSFVKDQLAAQKGDGRAVERIVRAGKELASVGKPMTDKDGNVLEERAIAETAGAGGELVAPLYLQDEYLKLARAARPYFDCLTPRPLPPNTNSINIPGLETGTAVAAQADLGNVQSTDLKTKLLTFPVITEAGQQDFARQLFDRAVPELADMVVFPDLVADYLTKTDVQAISGNGSSPNAKGVLSAVLAGGKVTFTSGSPTVKELYKKMADAIQRVHTKRFLPPDAIIMHPRRWGWLLASVDTAERPLILPIAEAHFNSLGALQRVASEAVVGSMFGLPVIVDASLPTNEGAGTNQDAIIIQRTADAWVLEDEPVKTRVYEEVLSKELAVRAQVFNYLALTHERYATAIAVIQGTGLVEPTF
jgi:HK97 family phage major capsid protein